MGKPVCKAHLGSTSHPRLRPWLPSPWQAQQLSRQALPFRRSHSCPWLPAQQPEKVSRLVGTQPMNLRHSKAPQTLMSSGKLCPSTPDTAVCMAKGRGRAWKGPPAGQSSASRSPRSSGLTPPSLPFPQTAGPQRGHMLSTAILLACGHTHRAAVPPTPTDCHGQPGRAHGSLPRVGWGC